MNLSISERSLAPSARLPKKWAMWPALLSLVVATLMAVSTEVLQAQTSGPTRQSWTVGLAAGVFNYELSGEQGSPIIALRADRPLSKWVRMEVSTTYTRPEVQTDSLGMFDPALPTERTNLVTITLGFQARVTLGRLEPYAGAAVGFFARYDGGTAGRRSTNSTLQVPLGIRFWVTDNFGVRGEYRFDEDRHEFMTSSDSEITAGVFWTF